MTLYNGEHKPTPELRQRIKDLAIAGIPLHVICKVIKLNDDTVRKYYSRELECAEPEAIERVAKTIVMQAEAGDAKAQNLYMKTKGAKYGWVEKQVIETRSDEDTMELKNRIAELEAQHERDY